MPVPEPSASAVPYEPELTPSPLPTIEPVYPGFRQGLAARVEYTRNGVMLGMGRFVVQVRVYNPMPSPQGGLLTVEFWASDSLVRTLREPVFLHPGEIQFRTYEEPAWRVNLARASVTGQPVDPEVPFFK